MAKADCSSIEFNRTSAVVVARGQALGLIDMLIDGGMDDDHFAMGHEHAMSVLAAAGALLRGADGDEAYLLDAAYDRKVAAETAATEAVAVVRAEISRRRLGGGKLRLVTEETIPLLASFDALRREGGTE